MHTKAVADWLTNQQLQKGISTFEKLLSRNLLFLLASLVHFWLCTKFQAFIKRSSLVRNWFGSQYSRVSAEGNFVENPPGEISKGGRLNKNKNILCYKSKK